MSNQKYNSPNSPPPYNNDISSPQPAHVQPQYQQGSDLYGASPYPQNNGYPPPNQGGYYAPGPQMYQQPQQQYGGYYGSGPQQGYGPGGQYGPPQGGNYREDRGMGAGGGCFAAMCGVLAACCCLDMLF